MLELTVRLVFSLAAVVGLLLLLAKLSSRRFKGRAGAAVTVLHRQSLTRSSQVSLVSVGDRVLLLGVTEHQISLLTELDPLEVPALTAEPADAAATGAVTGTTTGTATTDTPALPVGHAEHPFRAALAQATPAAGTSERAGVDIVADLLATRRPARPMAAVPALPEPTAATEPPAVDPSVAQLVVPGSPATHGSGPLAGSVLSPQTWRQALAVVTRRAS